MSPANQDRASAPLDQSREGSLDLASAACIQHHKIYAENICGRLHLSCFGGGKTRVGRVDKESDRTFCRLKLMQQFETVCGRYGLLLPRPIASVMMVLASKSGTDCIANRARLGASTRLSDRVPVIGREKSHCIVYKRLSFSYALLRHFYYALGDDLAHDPRVRRSGELTSGLLDPPPHFI